VAAFARSSLFRAYSLSKLPFKPAILKIQAAGRKKDALMLAGDFQGFLLEKLVNTFHSVERFTANQHH
jgi:hypothetical protein